MYPLIWTILVMMKKIWVQELLYEMTRGKCDIVLISVFKRLEKLLCSRV